MVPPCLPCFVKKESEGDKIMRSYSTIEDSPSTGFRYNARPGYGSTESSYNDDSEALSSYRSNSAPSDVGGIFVLRPKVWRYWLAGVLSYAFAICLENVIIFPSLWPRLKTFCGPDYSSAELQYYLGAILGAFSAGRAVSAVVLNLREHTQTSMRIAGFVCFLVSISSSVLYTFAWSPMVLIVSRSLAGLGAGALTLLMSTLVAATSEENRTSSIANFFIAAAVGEIVGPVIAFLTVSLQFQVGSFTFNSYNSVGVWTFIVFILTFPWAFRGFVAPNRVGNKGAAAGDGDDDDEWGGSPERKGRAEDGGAEEGQGTASCTSPMFSFDMGIILLMALVNNAAVSTWETLIVPIGDSNFGWDVEINSIVFIISGCLLFFSNIVLVKLAAYAKLDDNTGVLFSIIFACGGALLLYYDSTSIVVFACGNIAYPIGIFCLLTFLSSMYTKAIVARPNFFIGLLRASSAGIRVVGNGLAAKSLTQHVHKQICDSDTNGVGGNVNGTRGVDLFQGSSFSTVEDDKSPQVLLLVFPLIMLALEIVRMVARSPRCCASHEREALAEQLLEREEEDDEFLDGERNGSIDFALAPMDQHEAAGRESFEKRRKNIAKFNSGRR